MTAYKWTITPRFRIAKFQTRRWHAPAKALSYHLGARDIFKLAVIKKRMLDDLQKYFKICSTVHII